MPHHDQLNLLATPQRSGLKTLSDDSDDEDIVDHLSSVEGMGGRKTTGTSLVIPTGLRSRSVSPFSGQRLPTGRRAPPPPPPPLRTSKKPESSRSRMLSRFWTKNRAVILVAVSQLFGALMNLSARLLETDGDGMHPFQILFARMSITTVCSVAYMYYTKVPQFPFGPKEVRVLLVARGLTGFFGIYGMWWSMMYLPLAEATVITFLAPAAAGYICHLILKTPYTGKEQIAAFLALVGVVLIARPASLFGGASGDATVGPPEAHGNGTTTMPHAGDEPTPEQRLKGIGIAMIGVVGASGAYTTIRWIGKRAHPLISVTYFSVWSTFVSTSVLLVAPLLNIGQPEVRFGLPASLYQWMLLLSLGICGFLLQFMMTSGIGSEKSNRATAMVYTHMLFAAGFDKFVFGHEMGISSVVGCGLIVGSALWAVLSKREPEKKPEMDLEQSPVNMEMEEVVPMLGDDDKDSEEEEEDWMNRVR